MLRIVLHTRGRWKFSLADIKKKIFLQEWSMVKNLSCVSCSAWNVFPINSLGAGVSTKSTLGHLVSCKMATIVHSRRGGQNWLKFGPRTCWMTPCANTHYIFSLLKLMLKIQFSSFLATSHSSPWQNRKFLLIHHILIDCSLFLWKEETDIAEIIKVHILRRPQNFAKSPP